MSHSRALFYFCLAFIGGIFLNSFLNFPLSYILLISLFGIFMFFISFFLRERNKIFIFGFLVLSLTVGMLRGEMVDSRIAKNELLKFNDTKDKITILGTISSEPEERKNYLRFEVRAKNIYKQEEVSNAGGKVIVYTHKPNNYHYGEMLEMKGFLESPPVFEDFNYKKYLLEKGIYSVMRYPEIKVVGEDKRSAIYRTILSFRTKSREVIYKNLSPPQSLILASIILGDKSKLSDNLKEKLNKAGVRHITAVSGMHVVILTSILMAFLIGLGFWRGQAFYLTLIFIFFFIALTGFQPSGVRAGIMGGILLLAQKFGRPYAGFRALVFTAFLMLAFNPLLRYSVGFQLSFLATSGIIFLYPTLKKWLKFIPEESFLNLRSILAMTFSAQLLTFPILIYNFGYISLVSPITNILILPVLPPLMGLGFLASISGIVFPLLGKVLFWPCWLILTYMSKIIDWFSQFSFSSLVIENISWYWLVVSYLLLVSFVWWIKKREKLKFLRY